MWSRLLVRGPAAEIARARRIAEVLIRNGLGFLAESTGLTRFVPHRRARRMEAETRTATMSVPERLRRTLEDLGPTYIKVGQILSTRSDILPPRFIVELSKLLDTAPPVPASEIIAVVERELGGSLDHWYADFSPTPIASASIGQVHRATLLDGTEVIVKVQRPGVQRTIEADLNLLAAEARFLEKRSAILRAYRVGEILEELSQALRNELDYTAEGRNADILRGMVADQDVLIPQVHWNLTTRRVITLGYLEGLKLSEIDQLRARGYNLATIAERVVQAYLEQVFVHGVFHADPHPANILVCNGKIGIVDLGAVGYLTPRMRRVLGDLLLALAQQNADEMAYTIVRMGSTRSDVDRDALRRDVQRLTVRYYGCSLESVPIPQFLGDIMSVAFKHRVRLPADLALLARTVVVLEGVASSLDPSFVLATLIEPFVLQLMRERVSIKRSLAEGVQTLRQLEALLHLLPRRVDTVTEQLERGELTVGVEVRRLSRALRKLDAIGNRLSFSVIVAGIIVGSALAMVAGKEAAFRLPFTNISLPIPQIGFVIAGLLGTWLLFSIVRSKGP